MRYALALDLVDDVQCIANYEKAHEKIWPEVRDHLLLNGVLDMEIYRIGTRLFMIMEVDDLIYDATSMLNASLANSTIMRWEEKMSTYQVPTPWTPANLKWITMNKIFSLADQI